MGKKVDFQQLMDGIAVPAEGDVKPGDPVWHTRVTASKIAAIMGCDPYGNTPYTMWHMMAGHVAPENVDNAATRRGIFLEDGVAKWWNFDHPEYVMGECGTFHSIERPYAYATPDRLLLSPDGELELLEVKTQASWEGWGPDGSAEVRENYWLQGLWQCVVTGARRVHFAVLGPFLDRRDYVVDYGEFDIAGVVETVADFVDSLPGGPAEAEPDVTDPVNEYRVVGAVTPVVLESVDVSDLYAEYREVKLQEKEVKSEVTRLQSEIKVAAAAGEQAVAGDRVVATRNGDRWRFSAVK